MSEQIVFDPSEVASANRTSLDITPWISSAGPDWGDSQLTAYMSSGQVGSNLVDYTVPNRQITIPLSIRGIGGTTFAAARTAIQAKVGQWQAQGGWIKRVLGSGGTVFCDVVSAQLHLGGDFLQARGDADINASLSLEAIPDFYGAEETLSDHTETSASELIFTETTTNGGDFPLGDRVRIVVDEDQGQNQRGLFWGFRCRNYDSAATASLAYSAEALAPLDTATRTAKTGAVDGVVVTHNSLSTNWTPVVGTNIGGTTYLTHVGTYRVRARVFTASGTAVQARFVWDVNDLVYPTTNDAVRCYDGGTFHILDLGEIRLDQPPNTTGYRWQGQIQAKGDAGAEGFSVDRIWFHPVEESGGVLQASMSIVPGLSAYSARDEFNQSSGALTGKTAPVGGTWTANTGGDSDDFSVASGAVTRTAVSDTGTDPLTVTAGRVVYLPVSLAAVTAQVDLTLSSIPSQGGYFGGLVLRRASSTSGLIVLFQAVTPNVHVIKVVAGTQTTIGTKPFSSNVLLTGERLTVQVDTDGFVSVWLGVNPTTPFLTCQDAELATGGTLASGAVGISDANFQPIGPTRTFDNFLAWVPSSDAVGFASRSLELNTLSMSRQDVGGTAYGPVSVVSGDLPRMPNRSSGGTAEFLIKMSRGDLTSINDPAVDDISARVYRRPSYLLVN